MLSSCYYFYYSGLVLQKGSLLSYCLCLHGDTEVHNGKRITLGTQRKLGFEPGFCPAPKQLAASRRGWNACPATGQSPCGLGCQQKAVRLGAGDSALRAHNVHTLRSSGWSTERNGEGGMPVPGSSGLSPTPWRRQGLALLSF